MVCDGAIAADVLSLNFPSQMRCQVDSPTLARTDYLPTLRWLWLKVSRYLVLAPFYRRTQRLGTPGERIQLSNCWSIPGAQHPQCRNELV